MHANEACIIVLRIGFIIYLLYVLQKSLEFF